MAWKKNTRNPKVVGRGWFVANDSDDTHVTGVYYARKCDAKSHAQGEPEKFDLGKRRAFVQKHGPKRKGKPMTVSRAQLDDPQQWVVEQFGGSSDYMGLFYANTAVGPAAISQATLQGINNAPMFNPLSTNATVPGNSTGIVPTGTYLATHTGGGARRQQGSSCCGGGSQNQRGGTVTDLRTECNNRGLSCRGPNGKYLPKAKLVKLLKQHGGAFNGLYAMAPPSNQPTFHPTK